MEYLANYKTRVIQKGSLSVDGSFVFYDGSPMVRRISKREVGDSSLGYSIFTRLDEAKAFSQLNHDEVEAFLELKQVAHNELLKIKEEQHDLRKLEESELKDSIRRRQEHISLMYEIKANILKEFRIAAFNVSTPVLKKAMFTITGNKQFNRWGYNPSTDDDVFRFITVEQMEELFELLNHT